MATTEEAIQRVVGFGFSFRVAAAIVEDLGPKAVFDGMAERSNSGDAVKFVAAHGYDKTAAAQIVERAGAHIINTAANLSTHDPEELTHSLFDFPVKGDGVAASTATDPAVTQALQADATAIAGLNSRVAVLEADRSSLSARIAKIESFVASLPPK